MRSFSLIGLFLFLLNCSALSQTPGNSDAPLGLTWGASASDTQSRNVDLKDIGVNDYGKSFVASKMERALADQAAAVLSFGHVDKLWRVVINGRQSSDDPFGNTILSRYAELQAVLTEKYGKPQQFHRLGDSIYNQPSYFLAGIRGGQSSWYSNFDTPTLFIQLAITATDSSTGNYRLIYEYKPQRRDFEASKRVKEKGSL